MKRLLALIVLVYVASFSKAQDIDVLHYRYEIMLNDDNDIIRGRATIRLRFIKATSSITLDLQTIQPDGKGMKVETATARNIAAMAITEAGQLNYKFNKQFEVGDTLSITIPYSGIPSDGLIISKNKYGHRTFFADNWPNRGHNWIPCVDRVDDKASVEFIVTAPGHYQVVSNGIMIEETNLGSNKKLTHWKEETPISTKVMVIGVADFAVNLSGVVDGCIPVYSWVYPEDRDKGFYDYAQAAEILPYFIKNIGPYGFKKLANVQSKTIFGGLENANTIFYSESSVSGVRKSETLIAHEIAHQWFGNMATEESFAHLWLSEGFATYMTVLYMENKYGGDTAMKMLEDDRKKIISFNSLKPSAMVNHTSNYMELLNPNNYEKGGWVLHMLRKDLGDDVFWKSMRSYYSLYAGKTANTDDLRKVFEKESGKDLQQFFTQWVINPGVPQLKVSWKYFDSQKKISLTVEQVQKQGLYQIPLEISIAYTPGMAKPKLEKLVVDKKSQTFLLPVPKEPAVIILDPRQVLLFSGKLEKL